ncbi:MAG: AMP-binding protein, partial [bacterium]|nr:AMP-binding protein [bacterium]
PRPYRHYIAWLQRQDLEEAGNFWQRELAGFTTPTLLGQRHDDSPGEHRNDREVGLRLSTTAGSELQSLARRHELTLNTLVQGAWAVLLGRYRGQVDVLFGVTVAGRPAELPGVESMVGLFINTLPVRVAVDQGELLVPWLERLQARQAELRRYEYSPLDQVQKWSELPAGQALFDHIVVFENYPREATSGQDGMELRIRDVRNLERTNYPLTVVVVPPEGDKSGVPGSEMELGLLYDSHHFDHVAVVRMAGHFKNLLQAFVDDPRRHLAELAMVTPAERQQLVVEWNDTRSEFPRETSIPQLFELQAERMPDAVAVVFDAPGYGLPGERLSYRELNRQANQLAHHLRSLGVGPDVLTGIYLERSARTVVG